MAGVALLEGAALLVGEDALFIEERYFANCYFWMPTFCWCGISPTRGMTLLVWGWCVSSYVASLRENRISECSQ